MYNKKLFKKFKKDTEVGEAEEERSLERVRDPLFFFDLHLSKLNVVVNVELGDCVGELFDKLLSLLIPNVLCAFDVTLASREIGGEEGGD